MVSARRSGCGHASGPLVTSTHRLGPEVDGGAILSGHADVVPVDGQAWTSDPFTVTERNGKLYGRGTCDMKGFDALALAAVPLAPGRRSPGPRRELSGMTTMASALSPRHYGQSRALAFLT